MMKYLTRRKDPKKPDDYIYDGSKGTIRAERDIKEEEIRKTHASQTKINKYKAKNKKQIIKKMER